MNRTIILAAAILVAATVAAGPASAKPKPTPETWGQGYTLGYTETQTDLQGKVVATSAHDNIAAGTTVTSEGGAGAALPTSGPAPLACCSSSGCDTVDAYVTKKDWLGVQVVWRYHQVKHWCWSYPRITTLSVGARFSDVDWSSAVINFYDNGYGWYYTWAGSPAGGHYSYRQGSVSNCILRVGCISTSYPQIEIWVNGNGAWTWRGST